MARYVNIEPLLIKLSRQFNKTALYQELMKLPTADVQAFFTEDEIALINEYKDEVKAVDFKTAILNAVSVALDKTYWQNVFSNSERGVKA